MEPCGPDIRPTRNDARDRAPDYIILVSFLVRNVSLHLLGDSLIRCLTPPDGLLSGGDRARRPSSTVHSHRPLGCYHCSFGSKKIGCGSSGVRGMGCQRLP
jgi:hypothetical protein